MPTNNPYEQLAPAPDMTVRVKDLTPDGTLPLAQVSTDQGGRNVSPEISWDLVDGAQSYVVTCYDPDAPTMSGFWHWVVYNLPADVTGLAEGVGTGELSDLPDGAALGYNEALGREWIGAAPPPGHGAHRYFFTVSALDVPQLDLPADLTAARIHFMMREHVIARGVVMGTWANPQQ